MEATLRGTPGSTFLVSTMRQGLVPAQGWHLLSKTSLVRSLFSMEEDKGRLHQLIRTSLDGSSPDEVKIYPSFDKELDVARSLSEKNLVAFSNFIEFKVENSCNASKGEIPCLTEGCFLKSQLCNGQRDCADGYDERDCGSPEERQLDQVQRYRLSRYSLNQNEMKIIAKTLISRSHRFEDFYDIGDGDWGWMETNIDEDGEQFVTLELPETPDVFAFHVVSVSRENGISLIEVPPLYSTTRPVDFYCEGPPQMRR